jgi:MFS family permease
LVAAILLAATLFARAREVAPRISRPDREVDDRGMAFSHGAEAVAIAANLLVFANYSIWIVALPLLTATKFGFNAGQVGLMLLFVNVVHLASAVPTGGVIRKVGAARALSAGFALVAMGLLLVPFAPNVGWLLLPMSLYAIGQVAGNSSAGDLILRIGGGGGRAVGAVRLSSDVGLVAGPAAAGAIADAAGVEAPFVALGVLAVAAMVAAIATNWHRRRGRALR